MNFLLAALFEENPTKIWQIQWTESARVHLVRVDDDDFDEEIQISQMNINSFIISPFFFIVIAMRPKPILVVIRKLLSLTRERRSGTIPSLR